MVCPKTSQCKGYNITADNTDQTIQNNLCIWVRAFIHSVLRPLLGVANVSYSFAFLQLSLSDRIVSSQSSLLYRRPRFVLDSLFLICLPVFLLLLSAEYHNVLMCFSLCVPHKTTFCFSGCLTHFILTAS